MTSDAAGRPFFLITIDAEGDDLWSRPRRAETRNAAFLPRFQELCESHGLKPTYLTCREMALCPSFQDFGRDLLRRGAGEIGMHLHAWDTPPLFPLTADDAHFQPYLVEYPEELIEQKVAYMTTLLGETFAQPMFCHRAGRWSFDATYARILAEQGYRVDCSVTPHVSWRATPGDPAGRGGTDYSLFPESAYFLDPEDIARPGGSPLLEVPVTIRPAAGRAQWLRPNGANRAAMIWLAEMALAEGADYLELMLHSSELMPGGSPTFRDPAAIENLYADLAALFAAFAGRCRGATLAEYYRAKVAAEGGAC